MNTITNLLSSSWIQALGWTLLHSLWQSLLCVVIVIVVMRCIPSRLSGIRYAVATGGLLLIFLMSAGTFLYLNTGGLPTATDTEETFSQSISISATHYDFQSVDGLFTEIKSLIQSNIPFIVLLWSAGALLFSLRVFSGWWYIKKLRRTAIHVESEWTSRIQNLATRLNIKHFVVLAESTMIQAPIVIGYIKPMILIPVGMCAGLSQEQLESIFIHELIHIRRGDYFVNMIQSFLEALFFFSPFVWIISGIMRREREHCCDDAVVNLHGNPLAYAHALASLEEVRLSSSVLALSLAENKNQLLIRIKRIMEKSVKSYSGRERIFPVVLLLVIGLICASWMTIQSGSAKHDANESQPEQTTATDTTGKEKSAHYYKKTVTTIGEDGTPNEEIVEEFEGDDEFAESMFDFNFGIPPIPPIELMADIEIPSIPEMSFDFPAPVEPVSPIDFEFVAPFMMDTIPFPGQPGMNRDWDEFGKEFEKNFKEKFGDFYEKHQDELKKMMEEVEVKLGDVNNDAWESRMEAIASQQAQLAKMHELRSMQNEIASIAHEKAKYAAEEMKHFERDHAEQMKKIEEEMKAVERHMKTMERELKEELVKDGYVTADEKINSIQVTDEKMTINGKEIKAAHEKKYRALFNKFERPVPGRRE